MVNTLFTLGCIMLIGMVGFTYSLFYMEADVMATREPLAGDTLARKTAAVSKKKRGCGCCEKRMEKLKEHIDRIREGKKPVAQRASE